MPFRGRSTRPCRTRCGTPQRVPPADARLALRAKLRESRHLIPDVLLIAAVLGSIYAGIATATEAGIGVVGALAISAAQGSLTWTTFKASLIGGTRLYCMIALILSGAAFLTLSMATSACRGIWPSGSRR